MTVRLIDADAFADYIKKASLAKKYEGLKIDGILTVADVLDAVVAELDGSSLDGYKNAPTIEDLSGFFDKLWRGAYERGKEDGKAERGTGKWIRSRRPRSYERWCSECGEKSWYCGTGDYTFCPHCGAEMRGDQDGPTEV